MAHTDNKQFSKLQKIVLENRLPKLDATILADQEALLDSRDDEVFSDRWSDAYQKISTAYQTYPAKSHYDAVLRQLREHIFKRVYNNFKNDDLAAYISDDFDLILKAVLTQQNDGWVNAMWLVYKEGGIPSGLLTEQPAALEDLI